jgi:hypothetical protein
LPNSVVSGGEQLQLLRQKNNGPGEATQAKINHGGTPQQDGLGRCLAQFSGQLPVAIGENRSANDK